MNKGTVPLFKKKAARGETRAKGGGVWKLCVSLQRMMILNQIHSDILRRPERRMWVSTMVVALYLLTGVVFGFDVCDTGQYLTMYANIFVAPESVGYHFMYYLSGVAGGAFLALCPDMGVLGIRLLGLLCLVVCMLAVWRMLKPYISPGAIIAGNALTMVAFAAMPVAFCYDILSIMLYLLAIEQLLKHRISRVMAGGFLLGMNVFSRIPNVLGLVFVFIPLLMAWCGAYSKKRALHLSVFSLIGAFLGIAMVLALMALLGHLSIFAESLASVYQVASDSSGESSHSLHSLIYQQFRFYKIGFFTWLKLGTVVAVYTVMRRRITSAPVRFVMLCCALGVSGWMMWRMKPLTPIWVLCAMGCLTAIVTLRGKARGVSVVALMLMLIFPMGSDGVANNGSIILFLATPVAIAMCVEHTRMFRSGYFILAFALICVAKTAVEGVYFDGGALWHKTAQVDSPKARGILTTEKRAAILNDALCGIRGWVAEGDTLLVYGGMPMLNYLTSTRPAIHCCWPELLSSELLRQQLSEMRTSPMVLRQKFVTMGSEFSAPTPRMLHTYGNAKSNFCIDTKIAVLNHFLASRRYQIVWENAHFVLYRPGI